MGFPLEKLKQLEHVNEILPFLAKFRTYAKVSEADIPVLHGLRRVFLHYGELGFLRPATGDKSKMDELKGWIQEKLEIFEDCLIELSAQGDGMLQIVALRTFFEFVKHGAVLAPEGTAPAELFPETLFFKFFQRTLHAGPIPAAVSGILEEFLGLPDVAAHLLNAITRMFSSTAGFAVQSIDNAVDLLLLVPMAELTSDCPPKLFCNPIAAGKSKSRKRKASAIAQEFPATYAPKGLRSSFAKGWLSVLRRPMPQQLLTDVLEELPNAVMPFFPQPLALAEFFSQVVAKGGIAGVLALRGLFRLMTRHSFEFPLFYDHLFTILTAKVMSEFTEKLARGAAPLTFSSEAVLKLLKTFLCSTMLPAYIVAGFAKKLSRIALRVEAPLAVFLLGLVASLLEKHGGVAEVLLTRSSTRPRAQNAVPAVGQGPLPDKKGPILAGLATPIQGARRSLPSRRSADRQVSAAEVLLTMDKTRLKASEEGGERLSAAVTERLTARVKAHAEEEQQVETVEFERGSDPFLMDSGLKECQAMDSYLWEVKSLTVHPFHAVSTLAVGILGRQSTKTFLVESLTSCSFPALMAAEFKWGAKEKRPAEALK